MFCAPARTEKIELAAHLNVNMEAGDPVGGSKTSASPQQFRDEAASLLIELERFERSSNIMQERERAKAEESSNRAHVGGVQEPVSHTGSWRRRPTRGTGNRAHVGPFTFFFHI